MSLRRSHISTREIVSTMTTRGVQPKSLQLCKCADLRNSEQRLNLYEERPLLLVETQAQFFPNWKAISVDRRRAVSSPCR